MFHGTDNDTAKAICQQGVDFRMHGKNATVYGKGAYFAVNANYSNNYTEQQVTIRKMFLCRVVTGRSTLGREEYKRPPLIDQSKPHGELYDSCVNDQYSPSIYVIFDNNQSYPEFMIEYTAPVKVQSRPTSAGVSNLKPNVAPSQVTSSQSGITPVQSRGTVPVSISQITIPSANSVQYSSANPYNAPSWQVQSNFTIPRQSQSNITNSSASPPPRSTSQSNITNNTASSPGRAETTFPSEPPKNRDCLIM